VVYGQNSSSNIDDEDASIVGIVEIGYLELIDNGTYYDVVETTTANDIIID
jgi:hypothetical protein